MPERSSPHPTDYWMDHCAWCRSEIGESDERITIAMKYRDQKDYRKNQGKVVQFELSELGRSVIAAVVTRASPAKKEGKEILFQVCSDGCGIELSAAIKREWALTDANADA